MILIIFYFYINKMSRNICDVIDQINNVIPQEHPIRNIWNYEVEKISKKSIYTAPEIYWCIWLELSQLCLLHMQPYKEEQWVCEVNTIMQNKK
jgi:hypothetical protein